MCPTRKRDVVNGAHIHAERSLGMTGHVLAVLTILAVIGLSSCAIKPIPLTTDEVRHGHKKTGAF